MPKLNQFQSWLAGGAVILAVFLAFIFYQTNKPAPVAPEQINSAETQSTENPATENSEEPDEDEWGLVEGVWTRLRDRTRPIITLIGESSLNVNVNSTYTDAGATATDNVDGDITNKITVSGSVNTATAGTYRLRFNVRDEAGNSARTVTRTVIVVGSTTPPPDPNPEPPTTGDTTKPVITLTGEAIVNVSLNSTYTDAGATAVDDTDGNITANIIVTGNVNTSVAGVYTLNFNVKDAAGNSATQVTRTVNVQNSNASNRLLWGAYAGDSPASLTDFETLVQKPVDIQAIFTGWGSSGSFPSNFKSSLADKGKTLLIFWEPYGTTLDAINAGTWDNYMSQFAAAAKTYGGPVILSPLHEMNGNWDPWGGTVGNNNPTKVINAWKRMHGMFAGASNVKFVWAVNNVSVPNTSTNAISVYYPGDQYTDYVGIDGFNFGNPWQTFGQVFDSALATVKQYNKPIFLTSMASAAGSQKAAWITDGFTTQLSKHPTVAGWVWFNANKEQDWRVNSDSASLEAFKAIVPVGATPPLPGGSGTPPPPPPSTPADTDGDGLTDEQEINIYHTNPLIPDTDNDGVSDGDEVQAGTDPNSASPNTPPPSSSGPLWGAYAGPSNTDVTNFETLVGKNMKLQAAYVGWSSFPTQLKSTVADKGKTLVLFWEPHGTTLDSIIAGSSDSYLTSFAAAAQTYGGPIILAPMHQMNGNWFSWGGTVGNNTPAKVIAAWKKIHGFFPGITNVKFAWDVNHVSVPDTSANAITAYYPGDAYVDYVAADGWNWGNPWQTFGQIYSAVINTLKSFGKPIYLLSVASAPGTNKAAWITDAIKTQLPLYPEIAGWVWYNRNESMDWRVNSDNNSLNAFKSALP